MEQGDVQKLLSMEKEISKIVVGQSSAVETLCKALRRSRADLKDPARPIGAFMMLGPTGVGKTLLAKSLAVNMFGDSKSLVQLDMSEYMEKFNVSRLVGSPPGYVGYEEGGQLTEKVRRNPYSVVLFDEAEKAHPDVMNMLLQILEEGKLTDNFGRQVDFRNTIILLTSNVGAERLKKGATMGFTAPDDEQDYERMKENLTEEAKKVFRPEFLNRFDDIVVFRSLGKEELTQILELELAKVEQRLAQRDLHFELDESARDLLRDQRLRPRLRGAPHAPSPSRNTWRTRWPRKSSGATCARARRSPSPPRTTNWSSPRKKPRPRPRTKAPRSPAKPSAHSAFPTPPGQAGT